MKITATVQEAAAMTGLSKSNIYNLINAGKLQTCLIGHRRLIRMQSLQELVENAFAAAA